MTKICIRVVVLVAAITVLISLPGTNAPKSQAASVCNTDSCNEKCRRMGYSGGWCIGGTCSCYRVPPPRD